MKYAAFIIACLLLFAGGYFAGNYFKKAPSPIQPAAPVVKDSIIYKERIVYRDRPIPVPVSGGPEIVQPVALVFSSDTLKTDSLDLVINDSIRGELVAREIIHRPIIFTRETVRTVTEVQTVTKFKPPTLSVYGDIKTGGGPAGFVGAIEFGIVKKRSKFGFTIFKSDKTYYCISTGIYLPLN